MITRHLISAAIYASAIAFGVAQGPISVMAAIDDVASYIGAKSTRFDSPAAAAQAFKDIIAKEDVAGMAAILGLDPKKLEGSEGLADKLEDLRAVTAAGVRTRSDGDRQILMLGRDLWPFPFPLVKGSDGKWAFDTAAGLQEVVNRRVGENELQAIDTMRRHVEAQKDYAAEDRDDDGVLEYAQLLISSEGKTDGLYWPIEQGDGVSPGGAGIDLGALEKAKSGDGYFGYKYRILKRQGSNVAGGAYDYVINGNMIGGFALIAWPAKYGETGVSTFVVNQAGIVYERNFGFDTENIVSKIRTFNPGEKWEIVSE